jgi:TRAP-type C4-dicarboxylate transport system permease small subunit
VAVGEFVAKFPRWLDLTLEIFMGVVSFAFFVIVGWMLFGQIQSSIMLKEAYFMIKVVKWPFYCVLGLAFASCALAVIVYVYERVVEFFNNAGEKSFLDEPELSILGLTEEDLKGKEDAE